LTDVAVSWYDGVPSFELLNQYDLVIYDAGGYWYPLSHSLSPLTSYHNTGKPLIVVAPDINWDWAHYGEVSTFAYNVLHIEGALGIMPHEAYSVYADTGHPITLGIPKNVPIPIAAASSYPDAFDPLSDCENVLRQGSLYSEFGVGTCTSYPSYTHNLDPAGKLFAIVAYPGSATEGRVVTFGFPIAGLSDKTLAKQLAKNTIQWALQRPTLTITLYIEDARGETSKLTKLRETFWMLLQLLRTPGVL
jgi:hypothetical protein